MNKYFYENYLAFFPTLIFLVFLRVYYNGQIIELSNKNTVIYDKVLTISSDDATSLSLTAGDKVNITSKSISITAKVNIDQDWYQGFVTCTDLFAEYMTVLEEDKTFNPMLKPGKLNYEKVLITKIN